MQIELLAPAKNKEIGIAAIDCGADAVYIAGPAFGAREAAGNPVDDIRQLADYAHRFSAKVYATVNTIIYEEELDEARKLIRELWEAGVDAIIVQDLAVAMMDLPPIELHASTQSAIRTPEQAAMLASLGFTRLILERQLSLEEIRKIRAAVGCELEFFVHGALCVSYSGNCYLSQYLSGRSANRGSCIQACRSHYDLVNAEGRVLVKDTPLLSLKDYKLDDSIGALADAGICSFKIEGRLKNASYVKNVVRHYRRVIDDFCAQSGGKYSKSSSGAIVGGFAPSCHDSFNRGFTPLLMGRGGKESSTQGGVSTGWHSGESTKSIGSFVGTVKEVRGKWVTIETSCGLANGDGLLFISDNGMSVGMRADVAEGSRVLLKDTDRIKPGQKVWRNFNIKFEKSLETDMPRRQIDADVAFSPASVVATDEDGFRVELKLSGDYPPAIQKEKAAENIRQQLSKHSGIYSFHCTSVDESDLRFYSAARLNALRRELAEALEEARLNDLAQRRIHHRTPGAVLKTERGAIDYKGNCANSLARKCLSELGFSEIGEAYELRPVKGAELMRSRYCIRRELGLCLKNPKGAAERGPLFLLNNGCRLALTFDCKRCEMIVHL
ncbi:MAG: U32 family peptidase [Bacteroidales bacterium]|nr:U32 family peptidase [Bacteroidales bacterium]